jgi:hypothetical protein
MGQLGGGLDLQLLLEVLAVGFDRLDAQMESLRDLAGAPALPDQAKYLQLAVAERLQGRVRSQRSTRHESCGQPLRLQGATQFAEPEPACAAPRLGSCVEEGGTCSGGLMRRAEVCC